MYALLRWGDRHYGADGGAGRIFAHAACGTDLDDAGRCATCARVPDAGRARHARAAPGTPAAPRSDPVSRALREPHRLLTPLLR